MILSVNQPYFAPFPGFFYKIIQSDIFVILDWVQFPRGTTWMSRNRFKNDQGTLWMTIPVWKKGLGMQRIDDVRIFHEGRWAKKHTESLKSAYSHSPYFREHFPFLADIFFQYEKLSDLNIEIIRYLMRNLGIHSKIILLSELGIKERGDRLILEICKHTGATIFLSQNHVKKYIDSAYFLENGVSLEFIHPPCPVYPQLWGKFIPNLSSFDLLFNCGPKAEEIIKRPPGWRKNPLIVPVREVCCHCDTTPHIINQIPERA